MNWQRRVVKDPRLGYAVHAVCFEDNGDIEQWNDLPLSVYAPCPDWLRDELQAQLDAFDQSILKITRDNKLVEACGNDDL